MLHSNELLSPGKLNFTLERGGRNCYSLIDVRAYRKWLALGRAMCLCFVEIINSVSWTVCAGYLYKLELLLLLLSSLLPLCSFGLIIYTNHTQLSTTYAQLGELCTEIVQSSRNGESRRRDKMLPNTWTFYKFQPATHHDGYKYKQYKFVTKLGTGGRCLNRWC